jgi:hypothetical protein
MGGSAPPPIRCEARVRPRIESSRLIDLVCHRFSTVQSTSKEIHSIMSSAPSIYLYLSHPSECVRSSSGRMSRREGPGNIHQYHDTNTKVVRHTTTNGDAHTVWSQHGNGLCSECGVSPFGLRFFPFPPPSFRSVFAVQYPVSTALQLIGAEGRHNFSIYTIRSSSSNPILHSGPDFKLIRLEFKSLAKVGQKSLSLRQKRLPLFFGDQARQ